MTAQQLGADWLSGYRGSDTITGGSGAEIFHTFGDAGFDGVLDFSRAEEDRVQLDPGTVITMGGGGQMVLAAVSMSTPSGHWIFTG